MDAATLVDELEGAMGTELDRLSAPKVLIAWTDASLERGPILRTVVDFESHAATVLEGWASEATGGLAEAFRDVADRHRACADRVGSPLGEYELPEEPDPLVSHLAGVEGAIPRVAAGLVAYPLVLTGTLTQVVAYFINEADPQTTDRIRDAKDDQSEILGIGCDLLDDLCDDPDGWDAARSAAKATIVAAYEAYVDSLEALGINPKPVC